MLKFQCGVSSEFETRLTEAPVYPFQSIRSHLLLSPPLRMRQQLGAA